MKVDKFSLGTWLVAIRPDGWGQPADRGRRGGTLRASSPAGKGGDFCLGRLWEKRGANHGAAISVGRKGAS